MIQNIKLKNFQSHKETELKTLPGINVITGTSDSGKSAIIRAINWLINNRPSGDAFRSIWGDDTEVEIDFSDCKIKRYKGDDGNLYFNNNKKYESFKSDVPDDIKQIINISDINLQSQLDGPFLLSETSGNITKYLNSIVNLDIIDNILSEAEKMRRHFKSKLEYKREDLKRHSDNLKKYKHLEEKEKIYSEINSKQNILNEKEKLIMKIAGLVVEAENMKEQLDKIDNRLVFKDKINNINQEYNRLYSEGKEKNKQLEKLIHIIKMIETIKLQINGTENTLVEYQNKLKEIMPDVCPLCGSVINEKT